MILPEHEPLRWFVPGTVFTSDGAGNWSANIVSADGGTWEWVISTSTVKNVVAYYPGFIDLGGFVRESRTLNPLSFSVSRWATPGWISSESPVAEAYLTWITSTREIPQPLTYAPWEYALESAETFGDLVGFQNQAWTTNSTITSELMQQLDVQTLGTLQPTAGAGLHTLFQVAFEAKENTGNENTFSVPPSVVTISQEVVTEPELEYVYRLKRLMDLNQDEA